MKKFIENQLAKSFEFEGTKIQIHWEGEDPWFIANELCAVFGYGNPRQAVKRHVKEKDVTKRDTLTAKGRQSVTYISEPGMYDLARRSKMPIADRFYNKVTHKVLPSIRKRGFYSEREDSLEGKNLSASDDIAQMMIQAGNRILELNSKIEEMTPTFEFGNELKATDNLFTATEVAKELGVSATALNRFLHDKRVIFKHRGCWVPYSGYDCCDYFKKVNTHIVKTETGETFQRHSLKITAKGQEMIHKLWREHKRELFQAKPLELQLETA